MVIRPGLAARASLREAGIEDGAVVTCLGFPPVDIAAESAIVPPVGSLAPGASEGLRTDSDKGNGVDSEGPAALQVTSFPSQQLPALSRDPLLPERRDEGVQFVQECPSLEFDHPTPGEPPRGRSGWIGALGEAARLPIDFATSLFRSAEHFDPLRQDELGARAGARRAAAAAALRAERVEWERLHADGMYDLSLRALAEWVTSSRGLLTSGIFILWAAVLVRLGGGSGQTRLWAAPYILVSIIFLCFVCTGRRVPGETSAYSVFNRGFRELLGTFNAGHVDNILRGGL